MFHRRRPRSYDHRLRQLVHQTGDVALAARLGVPRSTAAGWIRAEPPEVVSLDILSSQEQELQAEIIKLRHRIRILGSIVGLLVALLRLSGFMLTGTRLPDSKARDALLRAVDRSREVLPHRSALRVLGLSPSRFHSWCAHDGMCHPEDQKSCPRSAPNQLTAGETMAIKEMVTSKEYRHVPTSRLAILAQRLGKVFASPTTWARLVRERGWRRPRLRLHPDKPKVGLRTTHPDAAPLLVVDSGVENFNGSVDELVTEGLLRRGSLL